MIARGLDAGAIVRDLKEGIRAELDYLHEAASQQRFYDPSLATPSSACPRSIHELTTDTVLVQEYIEGRPFSATHSACPRPSATASARSSYRFCFGSLYRHGLFNGDPHPGNYLLLADGSVAFVDYGCVARILQHDTIDGFKHVVRTRSCTATTGVAGGHRSASASSAPNAPVHERAAVRAHALVLGAHPRATK